MWTTLAFSLIFFVTLSNGQRNERYFSPSVYRNSVNIQWLNSSTLQEVLGTPSLAKLVHFISGSCEKCRQFETIYKKLAKELRDWRRVLGIYVADCDDPKLTNDANCLKSQRTVVLNFYPSDLKMHYFRFDNWDPQTITMQLIREISKSHFRPKGPNFALLDRSKSLTKLFEEYGSEVQYLLLVLQEKGSKNGIRTLLNLLSYPQVAVRILEDRKIFANFGLKPNLEKMVLFRRNGALQRVEWSPDGETVGRYLESHGVKKRTPSVGGPKNNKQRSYLYDADNIELLTNRTIWKALKAPALGKLVQFMRPTCGACVSFAPKFDALAHQLKRWNSVLRIYYVNCDKEWDLCSSFNLKATPTLRFFPSRFVFGKQGYGRDITKREPKEIISALATYLSKNDFSTREPNFSPLESTDNLTTIFRPYDQALQYVLIVLQEKNSTLGFHTLLNLLPYTDFAVRIVEDPRLFLNFGLSPNLKGVILGRNGSKVPLYSKCCDGGELKKKFLALKGITKQPS